MNEFSFVGFFFFFLLFSFIMNFFLDLSNQSGVGLLEKTFTSCILSMGQESDAVLEIGVVNEVGRAHRQSSSKISVPVFCLNEFYASLYLNSAFIVV